MNNCRSGLLRINSNLSICCLDYREDKVFGYFGDQENCMKPTLMSTDQERLQRCLSKRMVGHLHLQKAQPTSLSRVVCHVLIASEFRLICQSSALLA